MHDVNQISIFLDTSSMILEKHQTPNAEPELDDDSDCSNIKANLHILVYE
jgi:hypothetical protein